eukprot:CAMPEP_0169251852 /NCGR_PEP_ID=MMETSP1016-20121227/37743_1 /TAXON_ID=342587 /ORGANISM="Karlodinium micrum, Strain CCMP2283" /LENGTH=140 /DNA_ID=CAMNT_0009333035 /DNA_START=307 /DNA_END=726 /DNA_ORIENTATION=-
MPKNMLKLQSQFSNTRRRNFPGSATRRTSAINMVAPIPEASVPVVSSMVQWQLQSNAFITNSFRSFLSSEWVHKLRSQSVIFPGDVPLNALKSNKRLSPAVQAELLLAAFFLGRNAMHATPAPRIKHFNKHVLLWRSKAS